MRASCTLALCFSACSVSPPDDHARVPGYLLVVQPDTGVQARRGEGGQAINTQPGSVLLTNRGSASFPWLIEPGEPWLGIVGPRSGVLLPNESIRIEPSIDAALAPTAPGRHDAELSVLHAITFHREIRISVRFVVDGKLSGGEP